MFFVKTNGLLWCWRRAWEEWPKKEKEKKRRRRRKWKNKRIPKQKDFPLLLIGGKNEQCVSTLIGQKKFEQPIKFFSFILFLFLSCQKLLQWHLHNLSILLLMLLQWMDFLCLFSERFLDVSICFIIILHVDIVLVEHLFYLVQWILWLLVLH